MPHINTHTLKKSNEKLLLKKGESITYTFEKSCDSKSRYRLFFTCEDASTPFLKNESGAELLYMLIDDSLNYKMAEKNRFCLDLSCKSPLPYAKRVVKKLVWQNLVYGLYNYEDFTEYDDKWRFGAWAKAENLKIEKDGYVRILLDVWNFKDGISPHDTTGAPDKRHIIDLTGGTYQYSEFSKNICLSKQETACVIITIEGENYSGNIYFERPFIEDSGGRNLVSEFDRASIGLTHFAWLGQNLSKREWPEFEININGRTVFDGETFLRVHRFSPVEIELLEDAFCCGKNLVEIKYKSDYPDTIPLLFDEILLIEEIKEEFHLVRCPQEIESKKNVRLLFEVAGKNTILSFESDDFVFESEERFDDENLRIISLAPKKEKNNLKFSVSAGKKVKEYTISRCVRKTCNNVISGSGDMIYIDISDKKRVFDYLKWYVENDIGSLVTIRPVYRWGGQKFVNETLWDDFRRFCDSMDLFYVHISDGRDIPGLAANTTEKMLCGKNFLGRQLHEKDGQLFYWSPFTGHPREIAAPLEEFFDLAARLGREHPETIEGSYRPFNIEWSDYGYSYKRKRPENSDYSEIFNIASDEIKKLSADNFKRHTGPAVMYKYFYENGFDWTGAETMDGATEVLLSFLRGASQSYGKEKFGVHLALQWSTFPHDNEKRYRRYLLSLIIPYMHGVTDINTEEGLWFMEARYAYHNRLSVPCEKHRENLRKFNRFIRTHSRTGTFHTPVAFLHGRMDGWNGFLVHNIWGMTFMKPHDDSHSWKVMKCFYPLAALDEKGTHKTGCVLPDTTEEYGLFSGTPFGTPDAVPVENGNFSKYSLLIFAGYNYAEKADLDRLLSFVENGGELVCTWAHFTDTTSKTDIDSYRLNIVSHPLTKLFSDKEAVFADDTLGGKKVIICSNPPENAIVTKETDNGIPLVYSLDVGRGKIHLVNTLFYPGNDVIYPEYSKLIEECTKNVLKKEKVKIECGTDVQYTIYNQHDGGSHIYLTAVDWYNDDASPRCATVTIDGQKFNVAVPFGDIVRVVLANNVAIWPENEFAEVMEINEKTFVAQGYGCEKFFVFKDGKTKEISACFDKNSTQEIEF